MEGFNIIGISGFLFILVGGAGLDSTGSGYITAWIILSIGMSLMAINLIQNYRYEKRVQANRIARAIERERRKA